MWYEYIDKNRFLLNLYNSIPSLIDVDIHQLNISDTGDRVTLKFNMPYYADNPPKKWVDSKYNTTVVELDFFCAKEISFKSTNGNYHGDIQICKDSDGLIHLDILGNMEVHLIAEACLMQAIDGYCYE
ncbi:Imm50 family immunity protein [Clostridium estertheticum]|uniref:Imm50 family immunity protein n=1 Tax=Clostridium estertheticum TaxID=238834 RepID=UPI001CF3728E|nr:Imm50 family immunity protein [Clostridium estertheticum]MCB2355757.1 immunity 50 family protein [Clostridium estertheticum]WAG39345.1 immunity 50 family protein [Clostridium estertheticum]